MEEDKKIIEKLEKEIKNLKEIEKEHRQLNSELIQKLRYFEELFDKKQKTRQKILRDIEKHIPRID